jgi:hypothetical protein
MPIFAAGASLVGGLFAGNSAANASRAQADAQRYAADKAAEEARFRPVGVSGSRYGTTSSQYDPATGRVTGVSYALTPEMQAYQDRFQRLAGQGLTDAEQARGMFDPLRTAGQQLFGMGQRYLDQPQDQRIGQMASGYLGAPSQGSQALTGLGLKYVGQDPQDVEQQYLSRQMALLAPGRAQESANLRTQLFNTGRGDLRVETGTGGGATNPELQAMYNARAQQDAILAANAQQAGQQSTAFGAGLLGQGQQLGMAGQGFGADLLQRQQALEQQRMQFGTGLFGAGSGLFGQYNTNVTGALQPYSAYADQVRRLEEQGMGPLEMSAAAAGKAMTGGAYAGRLGLEGATAAGASQYKADLYSPFGTAISAFGKSPEFTSGLGNLFGGGGRSMFSQTGLGQSGYGTGLAYGNQDIGLFV